MDKPEVVGRTRVGRTERGELEAFDESRPTPTPPELVADHPVRDTQQPCPFGLRCRQLIHPAPGNGEDLGGGILGVGSPEAPQAVADDRVVVGLEEGIETVLPAIQSLRLHFTV